MFPKRYTAGKHQLFQMINRIPAAVTEFRHESLHPAFNLDALFAKVSNAGAKSGATIFPQCRRHINTAVCAQVSKDSRLLAGRFCRCVSHYVAIS